MLVVEGDTAVRATLLAVLGKHGYRILEARNAGEALLICEQHRGAIDLLVTDMVMPRMSGLQLAERLGPIRPMMKVVFVSGHIEGNMVPDGIVNSATIAFLRNPITPETLARKVRAVLDTV